MRFGNCTRITMDNFGSVFKFLLYRLITGVIFFSLTYVILKYSLSVLTESAELQTIKELVKQFLSAVVSGDSEWLHTFQEDFQAAVVDFGELIAENGGAIAGAVVGVCAMYLLSRIVNGLATFTIGSMVNDRMSVFARTPFSAAYLQNVGKGVLYQLVYAPLAFLYDLAALLLCWFFFFYIPSFLPSWGLFSHILSVSITVAVFICLDALKMTLISAWMPAMIADKKGVFAAFAVSLKSKKGFWRRYASFLVSIYLILVVNLVFGLFTFGSACLITVPLSFLFLLALQFVSYYQENGRRYFVSARNIACGEERPEDAGDNTGISNGQSPKE